MQQHWVLSGLVRVRRNRNCWSLTNIFFFFLFFFLCGWLSLLAMLGQGFCCCSNNDNNITRRGLGAESFSLMTTQKQLVSSSVFVSSRPAPLGSSSSSSSPSISKCIRKTSPSSLSCAAATDFIIFLQGALLLLLLLLLPLLRFVRSRLYPFAFDCRNQFSLSTLFSPDESSFRVSSLTKLSSSVIHIPLSFRVLGFIRGQGGGSSLLSILRAILQLLQQRVFSLLKLSCFDFFFLFFLRVLLCSFLPSCSSLSSFSSSSPPPLACCNRFLDSSKLLTHPMWNLEILRVSFFTTSFRKSNREFCLLRGGWGGRWIVRGW